MNPTHDLTSPSRQDIPRISVDTIEDWRRIKKAYHEAALAQLDEQLVAAGRTEERQAYLSHITQMVETTFALARPNVRVNGRNLEDADEDEADSDTYDEGLDRLIWSLNNQRLDWDLVVAQKRRTVPRQVEDLMRDVVDRQEAADKEIHDLARNSYEEHVLPDAKPLDPTVGDNFAKVLSVGEELKQALPVQQERVERVVSVTRAVENRKL